MRIHPSWADKCPTCSCQMEEYICNEYWDRYENVTKEEFGLWCEECKEDKTSFMIDTVNESKIKEMKSENI